jgi:hypothetical protein
MSIHRMTACGLVLSLLLLGYALAQNPAASKNDRPQSDTFTGKAAFVATKNADTSIGILDPEIRTLGDRTFVVGRSADAPEATLRVWIPVSEVKTIHEFADVKQMAKMYRVQSAETK